MSKVTEFARIKLKPGYDLEKLRNSLLGVLDLQDSWVSTNQPGNHRPGCHVSTFYIDVNDQAQPLIITAPWESREGHHEWIAAPDNHACNTALSEFQDISSTDVVFLFHMKAAGIKAPQLADANLQGRIKIHRIAAPDSDKERLAVEYRKLEDRWTSPIEHAIWAGWKLERTNLTGQLVVFSTDAVPEIELKPLMDMATELHVHHLERII